MIYIVRQLNLEKWTAVAVLLTSCTPPPTSIPVTLTAPAATQTSAPAALVPSVQLG
jgi:hypothetical protein